METIKELISIVQDASTQLESLGRVLPSLLKSAKNGDKEAALQLASHARNYPFLLTGYAGNIESEDDIPFETLDSFIGSYIKAGIHDGENTDFITCDEVIPRLWITGLSSYERRGRLAEIVSSHGLTVHGAIKRGHMLKSELALIPEASGTELGNPEDRALRLAAIFSPEEQADISRIWTSHGHKKKLRHDTDLNIVIFYFFELLQRQKAVTNRARHCVVAKKILALEPLPSAIVKIRTIYSKLKQDRFYTDKLIPLEKVYECMLSDDTEKPSIKPQFQSANG